SGTRRALRRTFPLRKASLLRGSAPALPSSALASRSSRERPPHGRARAPRGGAHPRGAPSERPRNVQRDAAQEGRSWLRRLPRGTWLRAKLSVLVTDSFTLGPRAAPNPGPGGEGPKANPPTMPAPPQPSPATTSATIGPYQLIEPIGSDAFAQTWKARQV